MTTTKSQPLALLLNEIGDAVFCLNTLVVGLDAVEAGHEKSDNLDISWNPQDRKAASRKSRKFVVESVLTRVSASIGEHVGALSKMPRFASVTAKWIKDTELAQKTADIYGSVLGEDFLISAAILVVHWRNRIVHTSRAKLKYYEKRLLQKNEEIIATNYKGLSVDCLLCHFEEGRPTLKDVSCLISMVIKLARAVDDAIGVSLSKADLDALLDYYDLTGPIATVRRETKPEKADASLLRLLKSKTPMLVEAFEQHYGPQRQIAS